MVTRWLLLCLIVLALLTGCAPQARCSQSPANTLRVLFIGNSYTQVNDLPATFARLACAGGHNVETAMAAEGGWTLADHAASSRTLELLAGQKWDVVVLQEQSEIPAVPTARAQVMFPAARQLVAKISAVGAKPLFFMTWGHRDGLPAYGSPDYSDMQARLYAGYMSVAGDLHAPVAPVGYAWQKAVLQYRLDLWQADGSHPSEAGTYLAACVFYAAIFQQSPQGLAYQAGISPGTAQILQALAADTVLKGKW